MSGESAPGPAPPAGQVHAAELYCEACGKATPHRILRVRQRRRPLVERTDGLARCQVCRWTHPFALARVEPVEVATVVSDGAKSRTLSLRLPPEYRLAEGDLVRALDRELRVRRIDPRVGRPGGSYRADTIGTLWLVPDLPAVIPVSIVEGRRTRTAELLREPERAISVGDELEVEGRRLTITGLRAGGRTVRWPGEAVPGRDIERLYARRKASPPAGSIGWRSARAMPRAEASSTSRAERSRSSSGRRR